MIKKNKLKGSILYTVVAVMMIMTVFVFAALTMASAANRRAHNNYANNQTQYTARSVVDGMMKVLEEKGEDAVGVVDVDVLNASLDSSFGKVTAASITDMGTIADLQSKGVDFGLNMTSAEKAEKKVYKLSATVQMLGHENTVALYCTDGEENLNPHSSKLTLMTLGPMSVTAGENIHGGLSSFVDEGKSGNVYMDQYTELNGPYRTGGNLIMNTGSELKITMDSYNDYENGVSNKGIYIGRNLVMRSAKALNLDFFENISSIKYKNLPHFYIGGSWKTFFDEEITIGSYEQPFITMMGSMVFGEVFYYSNIDYKFTTSLGKSKIYGDVYLYEQYPASVITASANSGIYPFKSGIISDHPDYTGGNLYSLGTINVIGSDGTLANNVVADKIVFWNTNDPDPYNPDKETTTTGSVVAKSADFSKSTVTNPNWKFNGGLFTDLDNFKIVGGSSVNGVPYNEASYSYVENQPILTLKDAPVSANNYDILFSPGVLQNVKEFPQNAVISLKNEYIYTPKQYPWGLVWESSPNPNAVPAISVNYDLTSEIEEAEKKSGFSVISPWGQTNTIKLKEIKIKVSPQTSNTYETYRVKYEANGTSGIIDEVRFDEQGDTTITCNIDYDYTYGLKPNFKLYFYTCDWSGTWNDYWNTWNWNDDGKEIVVESVSATFDVTATRSGNLYIPPTDKLEFLKAVNDYAFNLPVNNNVIKIEDIDKTVTITRNMGTLEDGTQVPVSLTITSSKDNIPHTFNYDQYADFLSAVVNTVTFPESMYYNDTELNAKFSPEILAAEEEVKARNKLISDDLTHSDNDAGIGTGTGDWTIYEPLQYPSIASYKVLTGYESAKGFVDTTSNQKYMTQINSDSAKWTYDNPELAEKFDWKNKDVPIYSGSAGGSGDYCKFLYSEYEAGMYPDFNAVNATVRHSAVDPLKITDDVCILTGYFENAKIEIDPDGKDIYVGLYKCELTNTDIVVEDGSGKGNVYFFVPKDGVEYVRFGLSDPVELAGGWKYNNTGMINEKDPTKKAFDGDGNKSYYSDNGHFGLYNSNILTRYYYDQLATNTLNIDSDTHKPNIFLYLDSAQPDMEIYYDSSIISATVMGKTTTLLTHSTSSKNYDVTYDGKPKGNMTMGIIGNAVFEYVHFDTEVPFFYAEGSNGNSSPPPDPNKSKGIKLTKLYYQAY